MDIKRFIDRPILAGVISVVIVFMGFIGLAMLPIEQFPEIAPPTIAVSASYTGASAETAQRSVAVPLEEAINGVENMLYMTSTTTSIGSVSINVFFRQGTDPDMATVNVQNRVSEAEGLLPAEVTKSGVRVSKRQSSNLKILAIHCPDNRYDDVFISNYAKINIEPRLARVTGVGEVAVRGPEYAMRIWLDPQKMAQYSLMPSDISALLGEQNVEYPTGTLGTHSENAMQYDLLYKGRLTDESEFEDIVIKSLANGEILRLKDVATVELGAKDYIIYGGVNGHLGRTIMISQTAGSNANEVILGIDAEVEKIRADLPPGLEIMDLMDVKQFLDASIKNVFWTLLQAIALVILVVYIFLQNFRSTLIPSISIIVALIGTFAFLYFFGFSINLLTLFALVLVIGTVVDDAIVVVEAVQSKFDGGEKSPYRASVVAMKEISSALITTTVVFMAVFIPVCFMGGTTGTFYTQFGVTMAVAVALSTLNALTLSPALCALIMRPHRDLEAGEKLNFSSRFHFAFDAAFNDLVQKYRDQVFFFLKYKNFSFMLVLAACGGLMFFINTTKTALVPSEDVGTIFINIQSPIGYSYNETNKLAKRVEERIVDIEEIQAYSSVVGVSMLGGTGATSAMFIVRLKDWDDRPDDDQYVTAIVNEIYARTSDIAAARIMVIAPPMISGFGNNNGFNVNIQDQKGGTIEDLGLYTDAFIAALSERVEIERAQTSFDIRYPQYLIDVDAAICERNGVSPNDVLSTISGYVGGSYASNLNKFSKLYRVMIQASPNDRLDARSMENMYVRNSDGEMSPVTQYINIERIYGSQNLSRFNLFPAISVNGTPADGYSSGQAIEAIREVAEEVLPVGYGYEFGGLTREEESSSGNTSAIIFAICIIFVYLILCALYESIFIPLAVILSVPFGLLGSFLFANVFNLSNDIYMQTGLIMLIGLLAKTAILLTEYASECRRQGMSISQSALTAAKVRLRPILMTSLTFVFGMLPLVFASGVGANGNISLGVGVVGGMLIGTVALIFIVPALFVIFQTIEESVIPKREIPDMNED
ncbi:MAG: efflux RND transporter permease subunit [Rikenellaceae bacterium]